MSVQWHKIRDDIQTRYPKGYLLAVSGGVDSMFLLDFMTRTDVPFTVAHFNHGLRESGDLDQQIVTDFCTDRNIPCVFGFGNPDKLRAAPSLEAAARTARYDWLYMQMQTRGYSRIMTAHHLNDQAETVMLHLFRDHKITDLGMDYDNGMVYRPLLDVSKQTIIRHARNRNLSWGYDESNDDDSYERNWYRSVILPKLAERRNPLAMARAINSSKREKLNIASSHYWPC